MLPLRRDPGGEADGALESEPVWKFVGRCRFIVRTEATAARFYQHVHSCEVRGSWSIKTAGPRRRRSHRTKPVRTQLQRLLASLLHPSLWLRLLICKCGMFPLLRIHLLWPPLFAFQFMGPTHTHKYTHIHGFPPPHPPFFYYGNSRHM